MNNLKKFTMLGVAALALGACSGSDEDSKKAEQTTPATQAEAATAVVDGATPVNVVADVLTEEKSCEAAMKLLDVKGDCDIKALPYNSDTTHLVTVNSMHALVLKDGTAHKIDTPLYADPFEAVKTYVMSTSTVEISENDFEKATQDIRLAKRGYLLGIHFTDKLTGDIYITPNGMISGRVEKN